MIEVAGTFKGKWKDWMKHCDEPWFTRVVLSDVPELEEKCIPDPLDLNRFLTSFRGQLVWLPRLPRRQLWEMILTLTWPNVVEFVLPEDGDVS